MIVLFSLVFVGCSSTPSIQSLELRPARIPRRSARRRRSPHLRRRPAFQRKSSWNPGGDELHSGHSSPRRRKYILASGDLVTVTVWGHPELSGKRVIGPDGDIQLPFVGSFKVAGSMPTRRAGRLSSALREDYLNTAASVIVDSYNGNQMTVLGHVAHQGVLTFPDIRLCSRRSPRQGGLPTKMLKARCPRGARLFVAETASCGSICARF